MKILITDDEPLARDRVRHLLNRLEGFEAIEQDASNGYEAVELARAHQPDIVLMDIRMPLMGGLEAANLLAEMEKPPAIIFCTAYDNHAIEAFNVQAIGYLLKPVKVEDLQQSLNRASKVNRAQMNQLQSSLASNGTRTQISAKTLKGIELVPLDSIYYFMADSKYVTVYHENGETLIDDPLKDLATEFEATFVRIHRNALVRKSLIERMLRDDNGHYSIQLAHVEKPLSVSRRHVPLMKKIMQTM
ncbi:chemotaxis protein CheY [Endozoicomonas montiporae]|uniref:Chemotaxis protein CheY n=2 Tax=Endozoicomonas montiporae TaxID=1027273 RepID=A0A081MZL1_9GAMM|nr:LytTR family DNA-binding domain-containing protein [Endozoicomonas montiporae]AMO54683.1 alginate biosynthesis regulatory protein AlgR [Endozoicomonas montiporae CL-33]KEQ11634.1 chemotaxis protein CheY [Endozoicomonas montiporae]